MQLSLISKKFLQLIIFSTNSFMHSKVGGLIGAIGLLVLNSVELVAKVEVANAIMVVVEAVKVAAAKVAAVKKVVDQIHAMVLKKNISNATLILAKVR